MEISKITYRNSVNFKAQSDTRTPESNNKKSFTNTKFISVGATAAAAIGLAIIAIKSHRVKPTPNKPQAINEITQVADKLNYDIQPVIFDRNIKPKEAQSKFEIYEDIIKNMRKDENTSKRLDEVSKSISDDLKALKDKVAELANKEKQPTLPWENFDFDIAKKRYYSLPENKQNGYCCLDPLLYQKPREEIADIQVGYSLLSDLNENTECKLLNTLRQVLASKLTNENNKFIDECIAKLLPHDAKCYGQNSVFHSHELTKLGRIFREAMGLQIK